MLKPIGTDRPQADLTRASGRSVARPLSWRVVRTYRTGARHAPAAPSGSFIRPAPTAQIGRHARVQRLTVNAPHGLQSAQSPLRAAGTARSDPTRCRRTWCSCRKCWASTRTTPSGTSTGRTRRNTNSSPTRSGRSSPMAERGLSARPPRQRAAVEVPDPAPREPRRVHRRSRGTRDAALRARDAAARRVEVHAICVHLGLREAHRQRQLDLLCEIIDARCRADAPADRRRRFQRLAPARPPVAGALRPARGLPRSAWPAGEDVSRALAAAAAGSHLRAQRAQPRTARAVGTAVVAPVRSRAAVRGIEL